MKVHQCLGVSGYVGVNYWSLSSFSLCLKFAIRINVLNHIIYFNNYLSIIYFCCN